MDFSQVALAKRVTDSGVNVQRLCEPRAGGHNIEDCLNTFGATMPVNSPFGPFRDYRFTLSCETCALAPAMHEIGYRIVQPHDANTTAARQRMHTADGYQRTTLL